MKGWQIVILNRAITLLLKRLSFPRSLYFSFSLSTSTPFPGWVCSYLCPTCLISHKQESPALQLSQNWWVELTGKQTVEELTTSLLAVVTNKPNQQGHGDYGLSQPRPLQGGSSEKQEMLGWFLLPGPGSSGSEAGKKRHSWGVVFQPPPPLLHVYLGFFPEFISLCLLPDSFRIWKQRRKIEKGDSGGVVGGDGRRGIT